MSNHGMVRILNKSFNIWKTYFVAKMPSQIWTKGPDFGHLNIKKLDILAIQLFGFRKVGQIMWLKMAAENPDKKVQIFDVSGFWAFVIQMFTVPHSTLDIECLDFGHYTIWFPLSQLDVGQQKV